MIPKRELRLTVFDRLYFKKYIEKVTAGTSINNISNEHITSIYLPIPPMELLQKFENSVIPVYEYIGELMEENQILKSLRDFLLPLLMNGQVTFKEEA